MKKFFILILILITVSIVLIFVNSNSKFDRINPMIKEEKSYAVVEKGTQTYNDITIYNEKGKILPYTLDFNGYDPSKKYVEITHKKKYVKEIKYISKNDMPKIEQ